MILDTLANSDRYISLHPSFAKAFEYIKLKDLPNMEDGKFEIDGDS